MRTAAGGLNAGLRKLVTREWVVPLSSVLGPSHLTVPAVPETHRIRDC